jgi:sensor histidine kinase YesM
MVILGINIGLIMVITFFYRGKFEWKICASLFILVLMVLSDAVIPSPYLTTVYSTILYIIKLFLSKFLLVMLVLVTFRITNSFGYGNLSIWYWIYLLCCPFISVVGLYYLSTRLFFRINPLLVPVSAASLLIINILIFVLCDRVLLIKSVQSKSQLLEQQNSYYLNQYVIMKENNKEFLEFKHDFKNILIGIRAKLKISKGTNDELNKLLSNFESKVKICNTENIIIDSIINYKHQTARKYKINFSYKLKIPSKLKLDIVVISIILGNTLDNAIEACKNNKNTNRYISIQMQYLNDSLYISIKNSYVTPIKININGEIRSSKKYKQVHGIGLKNIKKVIDENNGLLNISYDNNIFDITMVLFNIGREY